MTTPPKTTLAILEDDKLVANLLRDFLNAEEEFQVIFIGYSLVEFIEKLKTEPTPDVILMDLKLKDGSGEVLLNHCTKNEIDTKKIIISSQASGGALGVSYGIWEAGLSVGALPVLR